MKSIKISAILTFVLISNASFAQNISPDSITLILKRLAEIKQELRKSNQNSAENIDKMLSLGMWNEAFEAISNYKKPNSKFQKVYHWNLEF